MNKFKDNFLGVLGFFAGLYAVDLIHKGIKAGMKANEEAKKEEKTKAEEWEDSIK